MNSHSHSSRSTALNTVTVGPLTMARAVVSTLVTRTRNTIGMARQLAAMVQSVDVLDDRMEISAMPEMLVPTGPLLWVPVGKDDVALRSDISVDRTERSVVFTLKLHAYVLDRQSTAGLGPLVSRLSGHMNTQVRINLRDTIEAELPAPTRKRLTRPKKP